LVSSVILHVNCCKMSPCLTKSTGFFSTIVAAVSKHSIFSGHSMKTLAWLQAHGSPFRSSATPYRSSVVAAALKLERSMPCCPATS
jgi:hypothetical protein